MAVIGGDGEEARAASRETAERYGEPRRELIGVERAAILGLRDERRLRPDVMRDTSATSTSKRRGLPA